MGSSFLAFVDSEKLQKQFESSVAELSQKEKGLF